jgi:hypothetical protein
LHRYGKGPGIGKTVRVMVVAVLLVALTGGAVLAATINGTAKNDTLEGTS